MSGRLHGITSLLSSKHSKSKYIHCANHSLDFILQEVAKEFDITCNALLTVMDIINMIRESSKRRGIYDMAEPDDETEESVKVTQLIAMCPTRWVIRVAVVRRFLENFHRQWATLNTLYEDRETVRGEVRARICEFVKRCQVLS